MKNDLRKEVVLPAGVFARLEGTVLHIKGPQGEASREFKHPKVTLTIEGNTLVLVAPKATKREKTMMGSFWSHARNLVKGVQEPHIYNLKICSGHFPMNVSVSGREFVIKNFLGETVARKVTLPLGAEVKITGTDIVVSSPDKEAAGLAAAKIENLCRITNRDIRIFQDGCYITHKVGKAVA
ncbi:MAG TPA: 50S ribosomal protein L6 [Candidatus Nanoarchaeia archaeon]|nr:50S ribosomal protein L6 [Candidatus Nanoarchaeia archaeon]